jgi:anti-sigma factor RsiW
MEQTQRPEDLIKRYLLGELSATEQTALEDEYFLNRSKYEQLCRIEDELVDSYTRGTLNAVDRDRFERSYLLNPQRLRHVKFSQAFARVLDEELAPRSPIGFDKRVRETARNHRDHSWWSQVIETLSGRSFALRLAFIIPALLISLGGLWFVFETSRLRTQLAEAQREAEMQQQIARTQAETIAELEAQARTLAGEQKRLQAQVQSVKDGGSTLPASASIIFALAVGVLRDTGQEPPSLVIAKGIQDIGLQLNLSEIKFPRYWVKLLTVDGKEIFSRKNVRSQTSRSAEFVLVHVPARKFASGDNILSLSGITSTGEVETLSKTIIKVRKQ